MKSINIVKKLYLTPMHVKRKYENIERTKNIPMIFVSLFSDKVSNLN